MDQNFTPRLSEIFGGDRSFRLAIIGSSNSGKSYLINELFNNDRWGLIQKFDIDRYFFVVPTALMDESYLKIFEKLDQRSKQEKGGPQFDRKKQVFEKDLQNSLSGVYQQICDEQLGKKKMRMSQDHSIIVLDDFILELDTGPFSLVGKILVKCRHANISIILASQNFRSLSPIIRNNLSDVILYKTSNTLEIKKYFEEYGAGLKSKQFTSLFNFATQPKYGYLLITQSLPVQFQFFAGIASQVQQIQI